MNHLSKPAELVQGEAGPSTYSERRSYRERHSRAPEAQLEAPPYASSRSDDMSEGSSRHVSHPGSGLVSAEYRHDPFPRGMRHTIPYTQALGSSSAGGSSNSGRDRRDSKDKPAWRGQPLSSSSGQDDTSRFMSGISDVPPSASSAPSSGPSSAASTLSVSRDPGGRRMAKRRPLPLDLREGSGTVRVDPELQEHLDDIAQSSAISVVTNDSTLSDELNNLTLLRDKMHRNLRDRPVYSPDPLSPPTSASPPGNRFTTTLPFAASPSPASSVLGHAQLPETEMLNAAELSNLLSSSETLLILDTRSLGRYLDVHLPRSVNIPIPTTTLTRLELGEDRVSKENMEAYITTEEGRTAWRAWDAEGTVVVLGSSEGDETPRRLVPLLAELAPRCRRRLLRGGWQAVTATAACSQQVIRGGPAGSEVRAASPRPPKRSATLPPQTSPTAQTHRQSPKARPEPTFLIAPPTPPSDPVPRLANKLSMPSLRAKRGQPTLTLQTGSTTGGGGGMPTPLLGVERPVRSATTGSFPRSPTSLRATGLRINTTVQPAASATESAAASASGMRAPSPIYPGTPSEGVDAGPSRPRSPAPLAVTANGHMPRTPITTPRHAMSPFIVSTILPGFLYLGPEIANDQDVTALRRLGVKRILNVALECEDESLGLKEIFERYFKIPMRDTVEESGVGKGMRAACDFLDDARLHNAPTYVHCKAGKSRSVTVVLAYLIHANAWTLKTSYAYVAERRKGISPNIGFVAELMQFEEAELGKQSNGVYGDADDRKKLKHSRDSLPPVWSKSLDPSRHDVPAPTDLRGKKPDESERTGSEREVRKNGQWVHERRPPVDRMTLQPSRRASKAGLESLRGPLAMSQPAIPHLIVRSSSLTAPDTGGAE